MTRPDLIALVGAALPGFGPNVGTAEDPFRATLKLGEIIHGRVLRSLGEGRYAVSFHGHERVIDSAIPLRTEEILHGRVVALGDRVELQRLRIEPAQAERNEAPAHAEAAPGTYAELKALVAQWPAAERTALASVFAAARHEEAVLLAARAVAKSGLPGSSRLVELVYVALAPRERGGLFPLRSDAVVLESDTGARAAAGPGVASGAAAIAAFAELLRASFDASRAGAPRPAEKSAGDADHDDEAPAFEAAQEQGSGSASSSDLAAAFFNAQSGGAVAHAVSTIPLIVDGRLVELDVAMFGEPRDGAGGMPHGRVVIELDTERLGHLHIDASLVGSHVQVGIASDLADAADFIAQHSSVLRSRIEADGWSLDGLRYEVRERGGMSGVAKVVMEHRVSADSLSRLI